MENLISNLSNYLPYILIGMGVVILLLLILLIILWKSVNRLENKYRKMMRGTSNKNLEEVIVSKLNDVEEAENAAREAAKLCENLKVEIRGCVQKVGIMRYKAFEDVGSDLSFSIAMLDGHNDGIVLTGLYGRHDSTTYAKPVDKGISRYELSEEEAHVLKEAMNSK
ncbi:DUF4446 family protein [Clostridium sardiniense]|uniref:DUF4446 family protein n=1 Tax=Clostridium sardiniense TaxID=29369 RepID=A0ABS7L208_CLOSR|nr:DUF4446 family protein [Clostridium sardiniense]MBM7836400.1 Na+-transporting methylmalonyl-CoA/oxaloacetate decarboxylase gamma subunit [Clostridium sardiniense]MBY0757080.1 DUF4446 family protein [Clostridium sardiniense]MDQ0461762.1 Na+-transporting methylmalonyl-CoA/oxaloacetate decarboxylase gamma subunit [Clostridium sardiniense]